MDPPVTEPIVWVELRSSKALAKQLDSMQLSVRDLTELVNRELIRRRRRIRFEKSTIGNLRSGAAKRLHPDLANAISEVIGVDRSLLFIDRMSSYDIGTERKAS